MERSRASSPLAGYAVEDVRAGIAGGTFLEWGPGQPALSLRKAVTPSIGVARVDGAGDRENRDEGWDPVQAVLQRADRARYEAKEAGKNRGRVA